MKTDVSVIIVSYNTKGLLLQSIASVYKHTLGINFEIIVADNASSDGSAAAVAAQFPNVIIIENETNSGFGKANNQAICKASGSYVFLLNSDAFLMQNSLLHFYNYMQKESHAAVGVCGGDLINSKGDRMVSFGNFPSLQAAVSELGFFYFFKNYFYKHLSSVVVNYDNNIKEVDYLSGADMFIRKSALNKVGLFDEDFFLYYEETELSFRLKKNGFRSMILPSEKIIHLEGQSQFSNAGFNYNKYEMYVVSRILFYKKCYGSLQASVVKLLYILHLFIFTIAGKEKGRGSLMKKLRILSRS